MTEAPCPAFSPATRVIYQGGEVCTPQLAQRMLSYTHVQYWNTYGPTEVTCGTHYFHCQQSSSGERNFSFFVPIGRPHSNTTGYVIDASQHLVPIGVPGELYLGGPKVARGYIGRADLTDASFVNVAALAGAGRLYKTGDRVRWLPEGNLEFLGRVDFQIKLNGQRIETGEIETVLRQTQEVTEAIVVARRTPAGASRLVAYVVPASVERDVLLEACQSQLPVYMVPSVVVALEEWPLSVNGKIDRRRLPAPSWEGQSTRHVRPRTVTEQQIAAAVEETLQVKAVSIDEDLLGLGLSSLLAVRVSSLLSTRHALAVASVMIMQHRTVATIAAAASLASSAEERGVSLVRLERAGGVRRGLCLSCEQEQMWVLYQLDRSSSAYNVPHVQRLRGELWCDKFVLSIQCVAEKHEVLRMKYRNDADGRAEQWAVSSEEWLLPVRECGATANSAVADGLVGADLCTAMELEVCSVRLLLVHVGLDEHVVALTVHHIATDGWSTALLTDDIVLAYNALVAGEAVQLGGESLIRYADYAEWQREMLNNEGVMAPHVEYWRDVLGGEELPVLELQCDYPRPAVFTSNGDSVAVSVDGSVSEALSALCQSRGLTLMRGVLSAWATLLCKHSGQGDVVVGIPYANREDAATHDVVGYFVNTVAIRVSVNGTDSFCDVLERTGAAVSGALAHAELPFVKVVEAVSPERDASRTPVFQTMLTWEEASGWGEVGDSFVGLEAVVTEEDAVTTSKFDVELFVAESLAVTQLKGDIEYNTDLFYRSSVDRMATHFSVLLQRMTESPASPLCELSAMDDAERELLLETWNATQQPYPESATAHELFEVQAGSVPDAVALVFEGSTLSYGELLLRTCRLGGRVRQSGVCADGVVGLCVEKSVEEVAGMVGIMRAGAAYVPLDPRWPSARLSFVMSTCACECVAAQARYMTLLQSVTVSCAQKSHVLCFGDSNTWGFAPRNYKDSPSGPFDRLPPAKRYTEVLQRTLGDEFCVIADGVNGRCYSSESNADALKSALQTDPCPSHVVLMLGTNDAAGGVAPLRVAHSARSLINVIRQCTPASQRAPSIVLISPPSIHPKHIAPTDWGYAPDAPALSLQLSTMLCQLAEQCGCAFIDGEAVAPAQDPSVFGGDGIHLSLEGHRAMAVAAAGTLSRTPPPNVRGTSLSFISLEALAGDQPDPDIVAPTARPSALAYVLFTSGSTGAPKGVMVEHSSLTPFIHSHHVHDLPGIRDFDRVLYTFALTFDPSVFAVWCTLLTGATLVIPRGDALADASVLGPLVHRAAITLIFMAPSVVTLHLKALFSAFCVRAVLVGGESLTCGLAGSLLRSGGGTRVLNAYGPCEATVQSHIFECPPGAANFGVRIPVGKLLAHTAGHVLDPSQHLVPIGVPGELYLGGPKVARGYIGRADLTDASFVHVATLAGTGRLYKTGDRVRWLQSGEVDFLGRLDFQLKLNGQRIEAREIEIVLLQSPTTEEALVRLVRLPSSAQCLVAFLTPSNADVSNARDAALSSLPGYMIPSLFVALSAWPLNASGKIDRARLCDLVPCSEVEPNALRPGSIEATISEVARGVLGRPIPHLETNLLSIGLTSLGAVMLKGKLQKAGLHIAALADLLAHPTVAQLAALVRNAPQLVATRRTSLRPLVVPLSIPPSAPPEAASECTLFLAAPALGFSVCYLHLAALLHRPRAVYGLDSGSIHDVESLARCHTHSVMSMVPTGPVHLGGWSVGGNVALEMAALLQDAGRDVRCVFLMDAADPAAEEEDTEESEEGTDGDDDDGGNGGDVNEREHTETLNRWLNLSKAPLEAQEDPIGWLSEHAGSSLGQESQATRDEIEEHVAHAMARTRTPLHRKDGTEPHIREGARVVVFNATLDDGGRVKPASASCWRPAAPDLEVVNVHTCHDSMMHEPASLGTIAGAMEMHLDETEDGADDGWC